MHGHAPVPQAEAAWPSYSDLLRSAYRRFATATRRALGSGSPAFDLDFTDRGACQSIFEEGHGPLLTDGSRACMETSHLAYNELVDSVTGERGLRLTMDDRDLTCGHGAEISVGHLASWAGYEFGDFEWRARVHHAPDGSLPPANSFTCLSTFVHGSMMHNELAWCFPANDGREVHMAYWYDDGMHRTVKRVAIDLTKGLHTYTIRWREIGMDWLIDDTLVHKVRGEAGRDVPWEPMSVRIILRPKNKPSAFLGAAQIEVSRVAYSPAHASDGAATTPATPGAPAASVAAVSSRPPPPPPPPSRSPPPPVLRPPPPPFVVFYQQRPAPLVSPPPPPPPPPPRLVASPSSWLLEPPPATFVLPPLAPSPTPPPTEPGQASPGPWPLNTGEAMAAATSASSSPASASLASAMASATGNAEARGPSPPASAANAAPFVAAARQPPADEDAGVALIIFSD